MLTRDMRKIVDDARRAGWILEPDAKQLLSLAGLILPDFFLAETAEEAIIAAGRIGYPVVAKVVSAEIIHKTEVGGVVVGIDDDSLLTQVFEKLSTLEGFAGLLVEEMLSGSELIVGAKNDFQFGPVILLGLGGTGVEIYQDTVIRMAPITETDVQEMLAGLKGARLLTGYRGTDPINITSLTELMVNFSTLVMDLENEIESIDLNPVKCTGQRCVVADARIMLSETL
ncbi:MAG: acetate--CoA ligase family protein [Desulfobacterales bacterium]|nr:acetate--CoA ligase family protein [Desulfobacterales bacterium]